MEKDKKLQSLLANYAVQQTSAGFDKVLLEKIAMSNTNKTLSKPLISQLFQRILVAVFVVVAIITLIAAVFIQPGLISRIFSIAFPEKMYVQTFSFLAAFWVVMFINILWNKKQSSISFKRFNFLL